MASFSKALQELCCLDDATYEKEIRRPASYLSLAAMTGILIGPVFILMIFTWRMTVQNLTP